MNGQHHTHTGMKQNGILRICSLFMQQHPIPQVETYFQTMNGGKTFTKLDLSQAYKHVTLDYESKNMTINTHKGLE